jgi:hypothetical protein
MEQSLEQVGAPLVAHLQALATEKPGECARHYSVVLTQLLVGVDVAMGDARSGIRRRPPLDF